MFRTFGKLFKAPLSKARSQALFPISYLTYPKFSVQSLFQLNTMPFSNSAPAVELRQHRVSESNLLASEFNLITRNQTFNKNIVLHTIERYLKFKTKQSEAGVPNDLENSKEFQNFLSHIIHNLKSFEQPNDLVNVVQFILESIHQDNKSIQEVASYIRNYKQILSLPARSLRDILPRLFSLSVIGDEDFINKFISDIKKSRSSYDINDYVLLLDTAKRLLARSPIWSLESGSEAYLDLISTERSYLMDQLDNLKLSGLLGVGELLFTGQYREQWPQFQKRLEHKLLNENVTCSGEDLASIADLLRYFDKPVPELWSLLEEEVIEKIEIFSVQELQVLLANFAYNKVGSDDLYMEIDRRIGMNKDYIDTKDFGSFVYYFAAGQKYRSKFFYMAEEKIIKDLSIFSTSELIEILWAYVHTNTLNLGLLNAIEKQISLQEDHGRSLEQNDLILLAQCIIDLESTNSPLVNKFNTELNELMNNTAIESELNQDLVSNIYRLASVHSESFQGVLPAINKYMADKFMEEVDKSNAKFFVEIAQHYGENYAEFSQEEGLIKKSIQKLEQVHKTGRKFLNESQQEEAEFTLLNLRGLQAARE